MIYDDLERELAALGVAKPKHRVTITQILMLRRRGMSDHEIGQEVGLSADEVRTRRRDALVEDYKAGMSLADIAKRHCITLSNISRSMRRAGVPLREPRMTDEDVVEIYQSHSRTDRWPSGIVYQRVRGTDLPLVSEEVEPPPRDELEDALMHWGELGTAQEYHVTVKHVRRWCAHYGITGGQDEKG